MITFEKQFNKLTEAYIKNEIKPWDACACFVGNILNNTNTWSFGRVCTYPANNKPYELVDNGVIYNEILLYAEGFYTPEEIVDLENCFLGNITYTKEGTEMYEESLFKAFEKTLDLLKEIHISKGEKIEPFEFKKRELATI